MGWSEWKPMGAGFVRSISASDLFAERAAREDALPQPPLREDPAAVLQDEAGFAAWRLSREGLLITLFERWFRERTGVVVCAGFTDGFGYRPAHVRDERGVWRSWGKYPKWFTRLLAAEP